MLAERLLAAAIEYENEKPRNAQMTLGPSELGGCREYLRNILVGSPRQGDDGWPAAAVVGTLVGDYLEHIAGEKLGALTQVPVTTTLPNGLVISGTADMVFVEENLLADGKTKDGLGGVAREGASLENKVQVSVYTLGLVQAGVLSEGASAVLVYSDRSGREQVFTEIVLDWESILSHIEIAVDRLNDVLDAQDAIDQDGDMSIAHGLRDKTPPFCYSERVMCPFRDSCWKGSEWKPDEVITDPETIDAVHRFVQARDDEKDAANRRAENRERLRGVSGMTPDGYSVVWPAPGKALYVTRVGGKEEG